MHLGERSWQEVDRARPRVLLIPLGSCEQHGPHLPLDTDTRIAVGIADRVSSDDVVVAPPLAYGASGEHADFAGTMSIGSDALRIVLVEIVRSIDFVGRVVFVNGHGGNLAGVNAAVAQLQREGHDVSAWSPSIPGGDAHAGVIETSIMLVLAPELVRTDLAKAGATDSLEVLMPTLRESGVRAVSANGVLGDPTGATPERGDNLLNQLAESLRVHLS